MTIDSGTLREAVGAIDRRMQAERDRLNGLDGHLGDGDLGITLTKAFTALEQAAPDLSDDLGQALMQGASVVAKVSSSSFGTLLATGLIAAAKPLKGKSEVSAAELVECLGEAVVAMAARGKAALGDKTVLDAMDAAAQVDVQETDRVLAAMCAAVAASLETFRDQPSSVGRARIFADRSVGSDDPGMVAFGLMLEALRERFDR